MILDGGREKAFRCHGRALAKGVKGKLVILTTMAETDVKGPAPR